MAVNDWYIYGCYLTMGYEATAYDYEMSRQLMEISHKETDAYLQAKQQELFLTTENDVI